MVEVIPFNVATAAKCDESHAEEVSEVVAVIPVTTLAVLREQMHCLEMTGNLGGRIIDNQAAHAGDAAVRQAVIELLEGMCLMLRSPPQIPAE